MSGILKPMILPNAAATSGQAVNADQILTYEGVTQNNIGGNPPVTDKFVLRFSMKAGSVPQIIDWVYPDQTTLDAAVLLVDNTIGAVVA